MLRSKNIFSLLLFISDFCHTLLHVTVTRLIPKASTLYLRNSSGYIGCHGRTASYPSAPAQIPACGTTALSSSEILASVKDKLVLPSLLFPAVRFAFFILSYLPGKCFLCRLRILSAPSSLLSNMS